MSNDRLKFRAWDKELKLMSPVEMLMHDGSASIYQPVQVSEDGDIDWTADIVSADRLEVMQWTGRYGKDRELVFEGDIFSCDGALYVVRWVDEYSTYCPFTSQHWDWYQSGSNHFKYCMDDEEARGGKRHFLFEFESYEIKVVGNIYENPDLMERANG